jgi:hypothetical protein
MTHKALQYTASIFLGLLSVGLIYLFIFPPSGIIALDVRSTQLPESHTVTVTGEGKVTAVPDIATVNLSVVSESKTVAAVTKDNTVKMNGVIASMKELGIDAKDMVTSGYNLNPKYDYSPNGNAKIIGYTLNQTLTLKIRDLNKVDQVLDKGTTLGTNQVYGLAFALDDDSKVKSDARDKAFADARSKAEVMAKAAGVKLGKVITFSENTPGYYPQPMYYAKTMMAEGAAVDSAPNVQTGSQEYNVSVQMTFEIGD